MNPRTRLRAALCSIALALMALPGTAAAAPMAETGWKMPRDVSLDGHRIDWLINITNVFITILFVIMVIWMFTAIFKHNRKHEAEYDHGTSKHSVVTAGIVSAVIFLVVDGNLWWTSTTDLSEAFWNFDEVQDEPHALKIEVNARQWIWQARYAGADGKFNTEDDAITTNDVRIPVDTPVVVQLGSPDVIHNMYLPNFRVKQDAIPGNLNTFWFQAKETGEFEIGCAQHCGMAHYKMRGVMTVLPKAEFKDWLSQVSKDSAQVYSAEDKEANWGWEWKKI